MKISISTSHHTYGYKGIEIPFLSLPSITGKYNYSMGLFRNGHRDRSNLVGTAAVLMYDFDDGYPLEECIAFFESVKISAYITTSKSHQKTKGDKVPCDRYRLMLPFNEPCNLPFGEYQSFYMYIARLLGFDEMCDHATQDPTRFFYPNPEQKTFFVLVEQVLDFPFLRENWRAYTNLEKKKTIRKPVPIKNKKRDGLRENELPRSHPIETKKGIFSFDYFEYLNAEQTEPCRCVSPSHPDRNPSAFVARSKDSGTLFVKCVSCGFIAFMGAE